MAKKQWPEVRPGEIWRDRDPRMWSGNRRVYVTRVRRDHNKISVFYQQVVSTNNQRVGREFESRYDRFQRAFEPIVEVQS